MHATSKVLHFIQRKPNEHLNEWSDYRIWAELALRLGLEHAAETVTGPVPEKSVAPMRSFIAEPMRYRRLFLADDAAHIVPPIGATGLNLAVSDVFYLY